MKINSGKVTLIDVLLHDHDQLVEDPTEPGVYLYDLEKTCFNIKRDGYYNVNHVVLPTKQWYLNTYLKQDEEYRKAFESIYIIDEDNKLYKLDKEELKKIGIYTNEGKEADAKFKVVYQTGYVEKVGSSTDPLTSYTNWEGDTTTSEMIEIGETT